MAKTAAKFAKPSARKANKPKPPSLIASGVGVSANARQASVSERVERAISQAVLDAMKAGVSLDDTAALRERMEAARRIALGQE